jgi:para-aminobenzoate synthetase
MLIHQPSILFIDAYDSFTNNIISLLTTALSASVRVIHIDSPGFETDNALRDELSHYDAVVCGPGPGNPTNEKDVGLMNRIWKLSDEDMIPVLGICLGFQSLCLAFGGKIYCLKEGLHGIVRDIHYIGEDRWKDKYKPSKELFDGVDNLRATLYHSLQVDIGQHSISKGEWEDRMWDSPSQANCLQPLAWAETHAGDMAVLKDDRILMAVRHRVKPFWGLQYHPESICTNEGGERVIKNWFTLAQQWSKKERNKLRNSSLIQGKLPTRESLLGEAQRWRALRRLRGPATRLPCFEGHAALNCLRRRYTSRTINLPDYVSVPDIFEAVQGRQTEHILLESSNAYVEGVGSKEVRGRYSIIGVDIDNALKVEYHVGGKHAIVSTPPLEMDGATGMLHERHARTSTLPPEKQQPRVEQHLPLESYGGIWQLLADVIERRDIGIEESPFWGGFIGYTTYELGLEGIEISPDKNLSYRPHDRPDLCFVWVTRSLVIDHVKKKVYVQQLVKDETSSDFWLREMVSSLRHLFQLPTTGVEKRQGEANASAHLSAQQKPFVTPPNDHAYESKVLYCQEQIREGESYELCLTDQTHVTLPRIDSTCNPQRGLAESRSEVPNGSLSNKRSSGASITRAWSLYKQLRKSQPAPFGAFLRLGDATYVSSSPERFLKWDAAGRCELRPMKGTVKKSSTVSTLAQAEALLQTPKERAENLMIVDLVRHDLHGICGPGNVTVPRLMVVEEYASVFQMISVVEGQIPNIGKSGLIVREDYGGMLRRYSGLDVLAASLPPGSMTGAPKKRSCEILRKVEGHKDRSLYSGVVGYFDIGGRGDFSVNIRCMFRWDDEGVRVGNGDIKDRLYQLPKGEMPKEEVWHIGAGGAVTGLSTPVGEREEMQTKLMGTLGVFESL